jgi:peptidoglycan/xylan/chitin deacetylase (PgdA/CDA1 family)
MKPRTLFALVPVALSCTAGVAGCGSSDDEPPIVTGDGSGGEDDLVGERQLMGGELPPGTVSLTFDDGPGDRTSELADYLASKGISATFFINGKNAPGRQKHIDAVIGRGHLLGNHTQNHLQLTKLTGPGLMREVTETDAILARAQPNGPWILRAPFGAWNGRVAGEVNATAMSKYVGSVFWDEGGELTDHSAADWACWGQKVSVDRCADLYMQEIQSKKRGIVLMHDIHSKTIDMVKIIVPRLIAQGFSFARLTDVPSVQRALAASAGPPPAPGGCFSATLGRTVEADGCVQSRKDQRWYRCVKGEWSGISAPDAACTSQHPL